MFSFELTDGSFVTIWISVDDFINEDISFKATIKPALHYLVGIGDSVDEYNLDAWEDIGNNRWDIL